MENWSDPGILHLIIHRHGTNMVITSELASLREFTTRGNPVVSLYLDVNGARFPRKGDYETEYSFLVHDARRTAADTLHLSKDQEERLDLELQAIGEFLALEYRREGSKGLVIFSCRNEDLWEVMPLKIPVENRLLVDSKPRLAPLAETLSRHSRFCVLLASKEAARIFEAYAGELTEQTDLFDNILKRHTQGGWEQAKLQRRHEIQVHNHLKRAAEAALSFVQERSLERLAAGISSEELWPELDKVLHPYLKERLAGRFNLEISAGSNDILERIDVLDAEIRHQAEIRLLDSLGPELEAGKNYVGGPDDVLAVLNERRVELLIVENGFSASGRMCNSCGTIAFSEETCPGCRLDMQPVADIVEEAREQALRQDAALLTVAAGHPAMKQAGGIAARLRY